MRRTILWLVVIVITALVQSTWLGVIRVGGVLPNLTLLLVVYFALTDGAERAMFTGFLAGVFQDVMGDVTLGHNVLCNVIAGYLIVRVSNRLVTGHPAVKAGLVLAAGLLHGLLHTLVLYVQQPDVGATHLLVSVVIPAAMYTALVTPVMFLALGLMFQRSLPHAGVLP